MCWLGNQCSSFVRKLFFLSNFLQHFLWTIHVSTQWFDTLVSFNDTISIVPKWNLQFALPHSVCIIKPQEQAGKKNKQTINTLIHQWHTSATKKKSEHRVQLHWSTLKHPYCGGIRLFTGGCLKKFLTFYLREGTKIQCWDYKLGLKLLNGHLAVKGAEETTETQNMFGVQVFSVGRLSMIKVWSVHAGQACYQPCGEVCRLSVSDNRWMWTRGGPRCPDRLSGCTGVAVRCEEGSSWQAAVHGRLVRDGNDEALPSSGWSAQAWQDLSEALSKQQQGQSYRTRRSKVKKHPI